jgi:Mg2+ and Co2+ transporter CorA
MGLEKVRRRLDRMRETLLRGGKFDIDWAADSLLAAREHLEHLEDAADEPPVSVDDGFAILPMARYEALREAEENLQETRFETAGGDEHDEAALRRVDELRGINEDLHRLLREQAMEIGRLKTAAKVRADATNTVGTVNTVIVRHIQDLQAEIDAIKDRLDTADKRIGDALVNMFDRINAVVARLNKLDAREVART